VTWARLGILLLFLGAWGIILVLVLLLWAAARWGWVIGLVLSPITCVASMVLLMGIALWTIIPFRLLWGEYAP
jgi:hypothetical protein